MRVTIVPEDRYVQVDGRGLNFDFPADPNIHAIQWYGSTGTVEQKVGGSRPATLEEVQPFVAAWEAERDTVDAPPVVVPPTLAEARATKTSAVKRQRDLLETQGFMHLGKLFDSDERSVQRITAAALTAQVIGASFTIDWTAADNSTMALNQAGMLGMPAALAMRANALHQHATGIKTQIAAAADLAALAAIAIDTGWPTL